MATLRDLTLLVSGLYRDTRTGHAYRREELLTQLPASMLDCPVNLSKQTAGVYSLSLEDGQEEVFELFSRRRRPRPSVT
jgi:hypothetical protein